MDEYGRHLTSWVLQKEISHTSQPKNCIWPFYLLAKQSENSSDGLWKRKSAPPDLWQLTDERADQLIDLSFCSSEALTDTVKESINDQDNGAVHHLVDDFALYPVHDLLNTSGISIFEASYSQDHISYSHDHHMGGNCIVACAVAFSAQLEISFCNWKIYLTSLYELSHKLVYANPALIRTFVAETLWIPTFLPAEVRIKP